MSNKYDPSILYKGYVAEYEQTDWTDSKAVSAFANNWKTLVNLHTSINISDVHVPPTEPTNSIQFVHGMCYVVYNRIQKKLATNV